MAKPLPNVDTIPVEEAPPGLIAYEHEHENWSKMGAHWLQVGAGGVANWGPAGGLE